MCCASIRGMPPSRIVVPAFHLAGRKCDFVAEFVFNPPTALTNLCTTLRNRSSGCSGSVLGLKGDSENESELGIDNVWVVKGQRRRPTLRWGRCCVC